MWRRYSTRNLLAILAFLVGFLALLLAGCASPKDTAVYYLSTTGKTYPPKPKDYPVPILNKPPEQPHTVIGRLGFATDLGWRFVYKSMLYNARANGADAVVLKNLKIKTVKNFAKVPPRMDWIPVTTLYNRGGCSRPIVTYLPSYRPGYIQEWKSEHVAFDSEMIVFKRGN